MPVTPGLASLYEARQWLAPVVRTATACRRCGASLRSTNPATLCSPCSERRQLLRAAVAVETEPAPRPPGRPVAPAELRAAMRATAPLRWPASDRALRQACGSASIVHSLAARGWLRKTPAGWRITGAGERAQESA